MEWNSKKSVDEYENAYEIVGRKETSDVFILVKSKWDKFEDCESVFRDVIVAKGEAVVGTGQKFVIKKFDIVSWQFEHVYSGLHLQKDICPEVRHRPFP